MGSRGIGVERRVDIETRASLQRQVPLQFCFRGRRRGEVCRKPRVIIDHHVHTVMGQVGKLARVEAGGAGHHRGMQVAAGLAGGQIGICVMGDGFGVQHIETQRRTCDVAPLPII